MLDPALNCNLNLAFLNLKSIFIQPVGESQQVPAVGGSDVSEDPGKDPGKSDEQPGDLD